MVKISTEDGEFEQPLIFNDPAVTAQMRELRNKMEEIWVDSEVRLVGLAEGPDGQWLGVFKSKSP